jgi:hypothetical protein
MAEQHCDELAHGAGNPDFVLRRSLEEHAYRVAPEVFESMNQMVAFGDRPYLEIDGRQARNQAILDNLVVTMASPGRGAPGRRRHQRIPSRSQIAWISFQVQSGSSGSEPPDRGRFMCRPRAWSRAAMKASSKPGGGPSGQRVST